MMITMIMMMMMMTKRVESKEPWASHVGNSKCARAASTTISLPSHEKHDDDDHDDGDSDSGDHDADEDTDGTDYCGDIDDGH